VAIAFYVFFPLKYVLIIYVILEDEVVAVKNFSIRVANTGWVPPNWAELAEAWVFVPAIIVDGIFYNCEYDLYATNAGDFSPYDSLAMMMLDTVLFIKFGIIDALKSYTIHYRYKVIAIFYAMCEFLYTLCLIFVVIFIDLLDVLETQTTTPSTDFILVLVVALLHPIVSRFTSMCLQGIKSANSSRQLRAAPKARIAALNFYVRWFWFHPLMLILNMAIYGGTFYLYISIYFVTAHLQPRIQARSEAFIQGFLIGLLILVNIFTVFYMVNLSYAILKRMGTFFRKCCGCACPAFCCGKITLDCSSYAKAMNRGLEECQASFRMNADMGCS